MNRLDRLYKRLQKIGIELTLVGNYPWIYLHKVNGNIVSEKFMAEHGFTIAFLVGRTGMELTDTKKIFEIIRKYR
jgi:hypothetical protein